MPTVILTVGIPASGKTTWAREEARKNPNLTIVSRDDIRNAHGWESGQHEDRVTRIHRSQIEAALLDGLDVIVADTNLNPVFRNKLIKFIHEHGASVVIRPFHIELDVAILRDDRRTTHRVGADVILRFHKMMQEQAEELRHINHIPRPDYEPYRHSGKPKAAVVDIDGTMARNVSRSPYDESKVLEDEPIQDVIDIIRSVSKDFSVIFVSGRKASSKTDTLNWLTRHFGVSMMERSALLMRDSKDVRPDYVVKNEICDRIIPICDIVMVFDDRDQVVRHLRARGITVAQVAPGRF